MTNIRPRRNSVDNFYNMIDNFFNDDFFPTRVASTSFKVDIKEDEDKFTVLADFPGFEKEDIDISFDKGYLTLSANKAEENEDDQEGFIHRERRSSNMSRTMRFTGIDEDAIKASLDKGLLTVEIPKKKQEITKKSIEIE